MVVWLEIEPSWIFSYACDVTNHVGLTSWERRGVNVIRHYKTSLYAWDKGWLGWGKPMTSWSSLVGHPRPCWQMMRQRHLWERENGWVIASLPPRSLGLTRLAYSIWISIISYWWTEWWALRQSQSPVHTARFSGLSLVGSYSPSAALLPLLSFIEFLWV